MAFLLWPLAALVPCLIGMGALCVLYKGQALKETGFADSVLTGGMICIGLAEAAHLGAVILGWSFSRSIMIFAAGLIVVTLVSVIVILIMAKKSQGKQKKETDYREIFRERSFLLFLVLMVLQGIYVVTRQGVFIDGDMTLETVTSFLESNRVYEVNPMTGQSYTLGIPMRLKILCLPTLYGALCSYTGMDPELVVYGIIPVLVLLASYLALGTVSKQLFPADLKSRGWFMAFAALLLVVGDYLYGMDGFGLLHSGFRGVTIRSVVLLPYLFGLMLRRKYKLVLMCVIAEACLVWTFYGMGACVPVAVGMFVTERVLSVYRDHKQKKHARNREEAGHVGTSE